MDDVTDENVFRLIQTERPEAATFVANDQSYYIEDIDGNEYVRNGYCVFTSHHLAIMKEINENSSVPSLVLPLIRVKVCELIEEDFDDENEGFVD